ncbi:MAG: hypothetical protein LIP77_06675 [Planctomycetes bacterium]|nr:hypothetical protein [Planctomycetota bacterium]
MFADSPVPFVVLVVSCSCALLIGQGIRWWLKRRRAREEQRRQAERREEKQRLKRYRKQLKKAEKAGKNR